MMCKIHLLRECLMKKYNKQIIKDILLFIFQPFYCLYINLVQKMNAKRKF